MRSLFPFIERLVINRLFSKRAPFTRRTQIGMGFIALSGLLVCVTLFFVMLAAYAWLLTLYTQPIAALLLAGAAFITSGVALLGGSIALNKKKSAAQQPASSLEDTDISVLAAECMALLEGELAEPIAQYPKTALAMAALTGFLAGDRLH